MQISGVIGVCSLLFFFGCKHLFQHVSEKNEIKIAFGSCNHQDKPQILWDDIRSEGPDLWLWLGDNIYGDSRDPEVLKAKYARQKENPDYRRLIEETKVEGVWDDHDYGENDAGKHFPVKQESQEQFMDFLDIEKESIRRTRKGTYHTFTMERGSLVIKFFLLDTRYFRDDPIKKAEGYLPNMQGSVLGDQQWKWLQHEMLNSTADVNVIVSSIQVISSEHGFEKWQNFPNERKKLLDLIVESGIRKPIILSGDRHIGEISRVEWKNIGIYEITSSSMTHGWKNETGEINPYRHGQIIYPINFGVLDIIKKKGETTIKAFLKTDKSLILAEEIF